MSDITLDALEQYVEEAAKASNAAAQASKEAAEVLGSLLGEETWTPVFVNALREQLKAKGVEPPEGLTLGQLIDLVGTIETVCEPEEPSEPDTPSEPTVDLEPYKVAWEADRSEITELVIPEDVNTLCDTLFMGTMNLKSLTIPANIKKIGISTFETSGLETLTLNDSITDIGRRAFANNYSLKRVSKWPKYLSSVPDECFANDYELETITFSDWTLEEISSGAFQDCWKLDNITLPETLFHIQPRAFSDCRSLKEIVFPEMLTTLGMSAFASCVSLERIVFNEEFTQKYIDINTFGACIKLKTVNLPASVTTIREGAFRGCTTLETINLEKITNIGRTAFGECKSLKTVVLDDIQYIQEFAFENCTGLETLRVMGKPTIYYGAFSGVPATCAVRLDGFRAEELAMNARSFGFVSGTKITCYGGADEYIVP